MALLFSIVLAAVINMVSTLFEAIKDTVHVLVLQNANDAGGRRDEATGNPPLATSPSGMQYNDVDWTEAMFSTTMRAPDVTATFSAGDAG